MQLSKFFDNLESISFYIPLNDHSDIQHLPYAQLYSPILLNTLDQSLLLPLLLGLEDTGANEAEDEYAAVDATAVLLQVCTLSLSQGSPQMNPQTKRAQARTEPRRQTRRVSDIEVKTNWREGAFDRSESTFFSGFFTWMMVRGLGAPTRGRLPSSSARAAIEYKWSSSD